MEQLLAVKRVLESALEHTGCKEGGDAAFLQVLKSGKRSSRRIEMKHSLHSPAMTVKKIKCTYNNEFNLESIHIGMYINIYVCVCISGNLIKQEISGGTYEFKRPNRVTDIKVFGFSLLGYSWRIYSVLRRINMKWKTLYVLPASLSYHYHTLSFRTSKQKRLAGLCEFNWPTLFSSCEKN